jgi:hypothetical protein
MKFVSRCLTKPLVRKSSYLCESFAPLFTEGLKWGNQDGQFASTIAHEHAKASFESVLPSGKLQA